MCVCVCVCVRVCTVLRMSVRYVCVCVGTCAEVLACGRFSCCVWGVGWRCRLVGRPVLAWQEQSGAGLGWAGLGWAAGAG